MLSQRLRLCAGFVLLCSPCALVAQQTSLPAETQAQLAGAIKGVLAETGTPSAEVGIVQEGKVVYTAAFGDARIASAGKHAVAATPEMPYGIGSISKQFTAVAVMLLVERGKLKLDDPVSTWFPELAHSSEITLRNLLNQVSGYEDYYTEDYLLPELAQPTDSYALVKRWTSHPLNFAPGTQWQYSNTNYVLAGLIVQKASGEPFFHFLEENVLRPAGLTGVVNLDAERPSLPAGYQRFGFGPPRQVQGEAQGTLSGAGQLAMPIAQLMKWDTAVMHRQLILKPSSWQVLQSEVALPDGSGSGYGMGFFLESKNGRRVIEHSGGLSGFTSLNQLYPDSGSAIAVLTNCDTAYAALVAAIEKIIFAPRPGAAVAHDSALEDLLKKTVSQIEAGKLDPALIAPNLLYMFTPQVLADYRDSLKPFGEITALEPLHRHERGGMYGFAYKATGNSGQVLRMSGYVTKDGKLDQLMLARMK
ncbi:MAG: beta-lactamase family protein [Acidobacteria bacterium]|nr:beta-lactamase family protein [Acidobacteriota bacterium]